MDKNLQFDKSVCVGLKYANSFSKLQSKRPSKKDIFSARLENLLLYLKSCILKNKGACAKHYNSFSIFRFFRPNKPFLVHNLKGFFVLQETLHLGMRKVVYMAFVLVSVCCCFFCDYFPTFFYSRRLFYNADLFLGIF